MMSVFGSVAPLFIILFICTLNGYSMMCYRLPEKRAYECFAGITAFCLLINSYIAIKFGEETLRSVILFTIGIPYFVLILFITKDKISQTVFNFWLWINIYETIADFSEFINSFTFKSNSFLTALMFVLFSVYFVVYKKYLKTKHRQIMEMLSVDWWIFSFIPMFFTALIVAVKYGFKDLGVNGKNYFLLFLIHILMCLVYVLIAYTFKTAYDAMKRERHAQNMKEQIVLQKKQYELYLQKAEVERIFRHDARHRNAILLSYLENGDINGAKELLHSEQTEIQCNSPVRFCENVLINAVLSDYLVKAQEKGIKFSAQIRLPQRIACDEVEFCIMISNLLENSVSAAKEFVKISIKGLNSQLSLNVENDYSSELKKDTNGDYVTTKEGGLGLGIKSVAAILKQNGGFLKIDDENGTFRVFATMKN